jgi:hypothetical protein
LRGCPPPTTSLRVFSETLTPFPTATHPFNRRRPFYWRSAGESGWCEERRCAVLRRLLRCHPTSPRLWRSHLQASRARSSRHVSPLAVAGGRALRLGVVTPIHRTQGARETPRDEETPASRTSAEWDWVAGACRNEWCDEAVRQHQYRTYQGYQQEEGELLWTPPNPR